jgi:glycyl-tRNA synthetase
MHLTTWKASGHVDAFNDPLMTINSKRRYRADVLIEDYAEKLNIKQSKKLKKRVVWRRFQRTEFNHK